MSQRGSNSIETRRRHQNARLFDLSAWRKHLNDKLAKAHAAAANTGYGNTAFICLLAVFGLLLLLRYAYIADSPRIVHYDESAFVIIFATLAIGSFVSKRLGFVEATILLRAGALVTCAGLWMRATCALIFHTGRGFPFVDNWLAVLDGKIGFDWIAYSKFFDDRPLLWDAMQFAYASIYVQLPIICVVLAMSRATSRLYALLLAQALSLHVVAAIAVLTPALGPWVYFDAAQAGFRHDVFMSPTDVASAIQWLRQTSSTPPVALPPLITFPSFHACCAVVFAWSMWRTPVLRWVGVTLNAAMLLATPVLGSHYLVDVIAGIAIAAPACFVAEKIIAAFASASSSGLAWRTRKIEPRPAFAEALEPQAAHGTAEMRPAGS